MSLHFSDPETIISLYLCSIPGSLIPQFLALILCRQPLLVGFSGVPASAFHEMLSVMLPSLPSSPYLHSISKQFHPFLWRQLPLIKSISCLVLAPEFQICFSGTSLQCPIGSWHSVHTQKRSYLFLQTFPSVSYPFM